MRSTRIRLELLEIHPLLTSLKPQTAEFRGPGVRRQFDDNTDDFDMDMDQRTRGLGGRAGRIILLGDGTEVLTDSDEHEIMDHESEEEDLESHAVPGSDRPSEGNRSKREGTPGPEPATRDGSELPKTPDTPPLPASNQKVEPTIKQAADEPSKEAAE